MMRSRFMNAISGESVMFNRRRQIQGRYAAGVAAIGLLALSMAFALPVTSSLQPADTGAGASVHAKNAATPDWMLKLQTRNAGQVPVTSSEPGLWI
jgi:hypothetical protein